MDKKENILGYWDVKGRNEPIKLLLEYLSIPYKMKIYEWEKTEEWFQNDKKCLETDFPNLPYFKNAETGEIITQCESLYLYLCNQGNQLHLAGENFQDRLHITTLFNVVEDVRLQVGLCAYNPQYSEEFRKQHFEKKINPKLAEIDAYLKENQYLNKGKLSFVDFNFYDILTTILRMDSQALQNYKNCVRFVSDFESIEAVKKYHNSTRYDKTQNIFGIFAKWRG